MKIIFVVRSLARGGAELQLALLCEGLLKRGILVNVATFYADDKISSDLRGKGINVIQLNKRGRWDFVSPIVNLFLLLRKSENTILYSFMTSANIIALIIKLLKPNQKVLLGVRASNMADGQYDIFTRLTIWIERRLMGNADAIIFNSFSAKNYYRTALGKAKPFVIHNGIDKKKYIIPAKKHNNLRKSLNIPLSTKIIGVVARVDPMKGYDTLFLTAANLLKFRQDIAFVCVASGSAQDRERLKKCCMKYKVLECFDFLSPSESLQNLYPQFDLLALASSYGEGLPNVLIEAMACGTKCVATNVGDINRIIIDKSCIVPPRDPTSLAAAIDKELSRPSTIIDKRKLRNHVCENFQIDTMISSTIDVVSREIG